MARWQLFEIEDLSWCPTTIRQSTTDFLAGLYRLFHIYEPAFAKIAETLRKTNSTAIVDCCSGSGGTLGYLREYLNKHNLENVSMTLTDKFPNTQVFEAFSLKYPQQVFGERSSQDATAITLPGMRTFFSSFHHFAPASALRILQNAVDQNAPIGIFECTARHPADFLRTLLSPIMLLFVIPFAKRLTWKKFIFTYLIPIVSFTNMWDYFVSNLRTYSPKELNSLVKQLNAPHYQWEIGKLWSAKAKCHITYLIGTTNPPSSL